MADEGKPPVPAANPNAADENKPPAAPPPSAKFQKRMALVVLIMFAVFSLIALCTALTVQDPTWLRIVFIYQGIQTIAFTAVGWVFGREVNRDGLQTMTELKNGADKKANEAQQDAAKQKATLAKIDGATKAHQAAAANQAGMVTLSRGDLHTLMTPSGGAPAGAAPQILAAPDTTLSDVIQGIINEA